MGRDSLLLQRSRETAIEILSLFDRISRLTGRAHGAAQRSELKIVQELVDQRQSLFAEAAEQVHQLGVLRAQSSAAEAGGFARMLERIGVAAREVQAENEALAACLAAQRDEVTEAMERSNTATLARVAYRRASLRPRVDLTR